MVVVIILVVVVLGVLSLVLVVMFRPGTDHLLEMFVLIGFVASSTLGGMKLASYVETKQYNLKG